MELIAASRIVKAQQRVVAARPYAEQLTEVIRNLSKAGAGLNQPLLEPREEIRTVGFVVVTADRGLAGGYNANVIRAAERSLRSHQDQGQQYSLIIVGRKGLNYFRYRKYQIDASFTGFSEQPTYEQAREVAAEVMRRYEEGLVDQVELVYTQFLSVGSQRVLSRRLLPMDATAITDAAGGASDDEGTSAGYEFEPDPDAILRQLLPRYVEGRLFAALLDAAASEQSARQRAMKSATDNANELIKVLERVANRARQEAITTEIMEIVGGAEALGADKEPVEA